MEFLEKDLEDIIFKADNGVLIERGLDVIRGLKKRQLRIGNYGIADIVTLERANNKVLITVYELKKEKVNVSTMLQATKYVRGIQRYIDKYHPSISKVVVYKIVLIGKTINLDSEIAYISEVFKVFNFNLVEVFTYSYELDGLYFNKESGYYLSDENITDNKKEARVLKDYFF